MVLRDYTFYLSEHAFQWLEHINYLTKSHITTQDYKPTVFYNSEAVREIVLPQVKLLQRNINTISSMKYKQRSKMLNAVYKLQFEYLKKMELLSLFEEAFVQRTHPVCNKVCQKYMDDLQKKGVEISKCYLALDKVFKFYLNSIFGPSDSYVHVYLTAPNIYDLYASVKHPFYMVKLKYILPFMVPTVDVMRTRRWAAIAHEAAHQKIGYLGETGKIEEELENVANDLSLAIFEKDFDSLDDLQVKAVWHQLIEMLCDFTSVLMAGPASPLVFLTYSPLTNNSTYAQHPPLSIRVSYMLMVLKKLESQYPSIEFKDVIKELRIGWNKYIREASKLQSSDSLNGQYIERYNKFLRDDFSQVYDFVSTNVIIAEESRRFLPSKWILAQKYIHANAKEQEKLQSDLDIPTIVNIPWVRITRDFPKHLYDWQHNGSAVKSRFEEIKYTSKVVSLILSLKDSDFVI